MKHEVIAVIKTTSAIAAFLMSNPILTRGNGVIKIEAGPIVRHWPLAV